MILILIGFLIGFFVSWFAEDEIIRFLLEKPTPYFEEENNTTARRVKPTLLFRFRYLLIRRRIFRKMK